MTKRNLLEAASVVGDATTEDGLWKVRLINEGKGSSGVYSAELLESNKHAFDNVLSYMNHTDDPTKRNFLEIVGSVEGETWTETAEDGTLGIYANWKPDEDYKRKLETYRDRLGLSIYISGDGEVGDDGEFHVTELDATDPFRSVDVVLAAGRGGRFEVTESLRESYASRRGESRETGGTVPLDENRKEIMEEKLDKLIEMMALLVAEKTAQAEKAAQVEADAAAVEAAVSAYDSAVVQIDSAELLPSQVEGLRAAAKRGEDVAPLIEAAKKVKSDAEEAITARLGESAPGREFGARKVESATELGKVFG